MAHLIQQIAMSEMITNEIMNNTFLRTLYYIG